MKSLVTARDLILKTFPEEIVAIYVYGSLIKRDMGKESDIDLWTIVKDNSFIKKVEEFGKVHEYDTQPPVGMGQVYSLWEFENDRKFDSNSMVPAPSRVLRKLRSNRAELVYGIPIDNPAYHAMTDKEALAGMIEAFEKYFIPLMREGKFPFENLLKGVYELTEAELSIKGHQNLKLWKDMLKLTPTNHPIHKAWKYRQNLPKDKKVHLAYVDAVEKYIQELAQK